MKGGIFVKRIFCVLPVLMLVLLFSSCGNDITSIEDYEWKMRTVMSNDTDAFQDEKDFVIVVGEPDEVYPDAEIVEVILTAKDGRLTISDKTNGKEYNGDYKIIKKTAESFGYELTVDGIYGYATASPTKYYSGDEIPTLPIVLGDYTLYFIPNK